MEITNKVAIVTGASGGIGLAVAKLLFSRGAKVVLAARSKDKLETLAKELPGSLAIPTDMTRESEIRHLFLLAKHHFGHVDILVNNAGQGYDSPLEKINIGKYRASFELNVVGPLIAMHEAIPLMMAAGAGSIVNVSSGTALMHLPSMSAYASLKRALGGLSLTAREELKNDKISISVIYPYITLTDFEKNTMREEEPEQGGNPPFPPDTPEHVAGLIVKAIETGEAEVYAHDWMKR